MGSGPSLSSSTTCRIGWRPVATSGWTSVISGFLITRIVGRELEVGRFSYVQFLERRLRRLTPAVAVTLVATLAASYLLLTPTVYGATLKASLSTVLSSSNLFFWRELQAGYFAADAKLNPLLHTWSLGVEEQFYLLYPLLLLVLLRLPRRFTIAGLAAVALASFPLGLWLRPALGLDGIEPWIPALLLASFALVAFSAWGSRDARSGAIASCGISNGRPS